MIDHKALVSEVDFSVLLSEVTMWAWIPAHTYDEGKIARIESIF